MPDQFKAAVGWRTPIGAGNGLPLKGKSPTAMFGKGPKVRTLPLKKSK